MRGAHVSRWARLGAAVVLGAGVLALSGCGGDDFADADLQAGKQTFTSVCASCHTLAEANTPPSTIGPNLDDAFRASREVGMDESQFAGVVQRWIKIAQKPMPRDLVTGQDARNVAAYIASVAGTQEPSAVRPATPTPAVPEVDRQEPAQINQ
jgi:mono/diheme cytochrome c family protein